MLDCKQLTKYPVLTQLNLECSSVLSVLFLTNQSCSQGRVTMELIFFVPLIALVLILLFIVLLPTIPAGTLAVGISLAGLGAVTITFKRD
jgi:hypothetical protein